MRRECRERHARAVMHAGIANSWFPLNSAVGGNAPGFPGACATRNFTHLVRGPWTRTTLVNTSGFHGKLLSLQKRKFLLFSQQYLVFCHTNPLYEWLFLYEYTLIFYFINDIKCTAMLIVLFDNYVTRTTAFHWFIDDYFSCHDSLLAKSKNITFHDGKYEFLFRIRISHKNIHCE